MSALITTFVVAVVRFLLFNGRRIAAVVLGFEEGFEEGVDPPHHHPAVVHQASANQRVVHQLLEHQLRHVLIWYVIKQTHSHAGVRKSSKSTVLQESDKHFFHSLSSLHSQQRSRKKSDCLLLSEQQVKTTTATTMTAASTNSPRCPRSSALGSGPLPGGVWGSTPGPAEAPCPWRPPDICDKRGRRSLRRVDKTHGHIHVQAVRILCTTTTSWCLKNTHKACAQR